MRRLFASLAALAVTSVAVAAQAAPARDSVVIRSIPRAQRPSIAIRDLEFAAQLADDEIRELSDWEGLAMVLGRGGPGPRMDARTMMDQLAKQLTQMLTQSLSESENFRIFERQQLGAALAEQDLGTSGRAAQGQTTAASGQLRTAQYIVTGAITKFGKSTKKRGGMGGLLGGAARGLPVVGAVAGAKSESTEYEIGITLKVLDATSGENIATIATDAAATGNKSFSIAGGGVMGGVIGGAFGKSATGEREKRLGEAMQKVALAGAIKLVEIRERGDMPLP